MQQFYLGINTTSVAGEVARALVFWDLRDCRLLVVFEFNGMCDLLALWLGSCINKDSDNDRFQNYNSALHSRIATAPCGKIRHGSKQLSLEYFLTGHGLKPC